MKKSIITLIIISFMLNGCQDQRIYEKIGFLLQVGIEEGKEKKLLVTYTSPVIDEEIKQQVEIINVEADLLREARENGRMLSPKTLEGGKIQQLLISNKLAEKGIAELFDVFNRDPVLPTLALVVIVDGSPYELLRKATSFEDKPRVAFYINQLLEGNIKSSYLPETRIWNFDSITLAPGIDPITPMLRLENDGILAAGSALFSEDKMVGNLNSKDTSLLLAMMGKLKTTQYITNYPSSKNEEDKKGPKAAILIKKAKRKITVKILNNKPVVNISLKLDGDLDEFKGDNISDIAQQKILEENLSKVIEGEYDRIMKYIVSIGSDPLGIGDIIRARYNSYWQTVEWKEVYKDANFSVSVELDIKQYGTID